MGELITLTIPQVDEAGRVITVDRKVVDINGQLYVEAPKNRKFRRTICPRLTPGGYPLAEWLAARIEEARTEQAAGTNPLGLLFPAAMMPTPVALPDSEDPSDACRCRRLFVSPAAR